MNETTLISLTQDKEVGKTVVESSFSFARWFLSQLIKLFPTNYISLFLFYNTTTNTNYNCDSWRTRRTFTGLFFEIIFLVTVFCFNRSGHWLTITIFFFFFITLVISSTTWRSSLILPISSTHDSITRTHFNINFFAKKEGGCFASNRRKDTATDRTVSTADGYWSRATSVWLLAGQSVPGEWDGRTDQQCRLRVINAHTCGEFNPNVRSSAAFGIYSNSIPVDPPQLCPWVCV